MIRHPQWQFVEDGNHQWHWVCHRDHVRAVSANSFADRADCVLDALQATRHTHCRGACRPEGHARNSGAAADAETSRQARTR